MNSRAAALMMAEFAQRQVHRGATWGRDFDVSTDGAHVFPGEVYYGAGWRWRATAEAQPWSSDPWA